MGRAVVGTCDDENCDAVGVRVQSVQVIIDGLEYAEGDLCDEHLAPLLDAVSGLTHSRKDRRQSRSRVWTMTEIERMKQEGKSKE